jgi:hypothetical protein
MPPKKLEHGMMIDDDAIIMSRGNDHLETCQVKCKPDADVESTPHVDKAAAATAASQP